MIRQVPLESMGIPGLTVASLVVSNLVSNVPAVMLIAPFINGGYLSQFADVILAWLTLKKATTFAGNLTLVGSVANLIVAESAARRKVHLGFMAYLKVGFPVTILTLIVGVIWLSYY